MTTTDTFSRTERALHNAVGCGDDKRMERLLKEYVEASCAKHGSLATTNEGEERDER